MHFSVEIELDNRMDKGGIVQVFRRRPKWKKLLKLTDKCNALMMLLFHL